MAVSTKLKSAEILSKSYTDLKTNVVKESVWDTLSNIDTSDMVEVKWPKKLKYITWSKAWAVVKKLYPDANYSVVEYQSLYGNMTPYCFDPILGYIVKTTVTIGAQTIPMLQVVMDGANKSKKDVDYEYEVKEYQSNVLKTKYVEQANMFDINTTIMRCLVKNIAMFGLGINLYTGEDLPAIEDDEVVKPAQAPEESKKEAPALPTTNKAVKKKEIVAEGTAAIMDDIATNETPTVNPSAKQLLTLTHQHFKRLYDGLKDKTVTTKQISDHYELDEEVKDKFNSLFAKDAS